MHILAVFMIGLLINTANSDNPPKTFDEVRVVIEQAYDERSTDHGQVWYNANVNH